MGTTEKSIIIAIYEQEATVRSCLYPSKYIQSKCGPVPCGKLLQIQAIKCDNWTLYDRVYTFYKIKVVIAEARSNSN